MTIIKWNEPWQFGDGPTEYMNVICSASKEDIIRYQIGIVKNSHPAFEYKDTEDAYIDFMDVHWAWEDIEEI